MIRMTFALGALLTLAACNMPTDEAVLENSIRTELGKQGTVEEVNLTRQDENTIIGHVEMRDTAGRQGRLNCTAERVQGGSSFNWQCLSVIDEGVLQEMEAEVRQRMEQEGEVIEVHMQRGGDDDNMTGHVVLRDAAGTELRLPCRAVRDSEGLFGWRCGQRAEEWAVERRAGGGQQAGK